MSKTSTNIFYVYYIINYTNDEKYMKTELSHNKIALSKSENLLSLFMIT